MSKTGNGGAVGVGAAGAAQVAANSCEKGQIVSDADGQTSVLKRADARRAKPKTRFRQDISASMNGPEGHGGAGGSDQDLTEP